MKRLSILLLALSIAFTGCKSNKYPDLKDGLYAELQT